MPLQGHSRSRAGRRGCPAARTCSIATRATARSRTCRTQSGITARKRHLRPRRQHARLQRRRLGRPLRGERLEPERALSSTTATARSPTSAIAAGCAYSQDGKPQAGMGIAVGDYDRNGTIDIFKTNFAGDTSTLYANGGKGFCEDRTFAGGIGLNTRWLGWGVGFLDLDNDGWLDLFLVNGHVYPEVERAQDRGRLQAAQGRLPQPAQRPLRGRHRAARARRSRRPRPAAAPRSPISTTTATSTSSSTTSTTRRICSGSTRPRGAHWLTLKLVGTRSNRSAIGARVRLVTAERRTGAGSPRRRQLLLAERSARALRARRRGARSSASRCGGRTASRRRGPSLAVDRIITLKEGSGGAKGRRACWHSSCR